MLKHVNMIIGNSSSGIIEAPSFSVPTLNIGNRQEGRLQSSTIINCRYNTRELNKNIKKIIDKKFLLKKNYNIFYKKNTASNILKLIKKFLD